MKPFNVFQTASVFLTSVFLFSRCTSSLADISSVGVSSDTRAVELSSGTIVFPKIDNRAFDAGEFFDYTIKYEFVSAGHATLQVIEGPPVEGRPTFQFISKAESTKFVDAFFKVRDVNASIVEKDSLSSLNFHQNLREGHYHVMRTTEFDYDKKSYFYERQYKGETSHESGALGEPVSDILSSFFYTRILPLERGKEYSVRVFGDGKVYPLIVKVYPKIQTITVGAGKFECIEIEPQVTGDAIFKVHDGKMYIWLTNDDRRIPVLIRSKVAIGAFDAELQKITLPTQETAAESDGG